jgi:hypothetical protein
LLLADVYLDRDARHRPEALVWTRTGDGPAEIDDTEEADLRHLQPILRVDSTLSTSLSTWGYRSDMPRPRQPRTASRAAMAVTSTAETSTVLPARDACRPRRRGRRPLLLDQGKVEVLLTAIRVGNRLSVAASYAGVSPKSMAEWMRRGRGVDGRPALEPYVGFVRAVEHAQAEAEVEAVALVRKAMRRNPKYAIWWLERMHPEWRRQTLAPVAEVTSASPTPLAQKTILIDGATLRRLSGEQIRAERGEADLDEATLARRARLVTSDR